MTLGLNEAVRFVGPNAPATNLGLSENNAAVDLAILAASRLIS
ncbi:hypothetical protein MGWOODY_Mmi1675 [hydrothermal vent metagenome]|uniref:Uncharacterized protein n=1 Tax=hydrothermal vent metagenome TaxID=652676 RepID=A0A160VIJ4_9ZZZZ